MAERSSGRISSPTASTRRLLIGAVVAVGVVTVVAFAAIVASPPAPDRIVYAARQGVFSYEVETGDSAELEKLPEDAEIALPSPDGRWVGYALGPGEVLLASLESDREFQVTQRFSVPVGWSPDRRLVVGEIVGDRDLVAIDPDGGRDVLLTGGYANGAFPVWLDADTFAISTSDEEFGIARDGEIGERGPGIPLTSRKGKLIVVRESGTFEVDPADLEGGERLSRRRASAAVSDPTSEAVALATEDGLMVVGDNAGSSAEAFDGRRADSVWWAPDGASIIYVVEGAVFSVSIERDGDDILPGEPERISASEHDVFPLLSVSVVA